MIRIQDFFRLSKEEMRDSLIGKIINPDNNVLSELGISGRLVSRDLERKITKKTWCWGYKSYDPGNFCIGITILTESIGVSIDLTGGWEKKDISGRIQRASVVTNVYKYYHTKDDW